MVQEARSVFNATPVNPRKCQIILTKLLFIISKGETLGPNEATDTFFAMTKLFQSHDVSYYSQITRSFFLELEPHYKSNSSKSRLASNQVSGWGNLTTTVF